MNNSREYKKGKTVVGKRMDGSVKHYMSLDWKLALSGQYMQFPILLHSR